MGLPWNPLHLKDKKKVNQIVLFEKELNTKTVSLFFPEQDLFTYHYLKRQFHMTTNI